MEGTFRLVTFQTETSFDLDGDGDSSTNLIEETGCYENETLTFNADNSGVAETNSFADIFVDVDFVNGEEVVTQIVECIQDNDSSSFSWSQASGVVTIITDGEPFDFIFNGDQLSFTLPGGFFAEVLDGSSDNVETIQLIESVTFIYERI